ncbi:heterokaryon incompatibility protein-domain-containing protein [Xylaria curta]|nr:heterokaryon incompatibility protein-domain-containing protein [Xylaria curta]
MDSNHYCLSAPTKEIRLLDLLPATTSKILTARIRRFPLDDETPPYIAVSHVWGDEKLTSPMHIESGCGNRKIQISRRLESLLIGLLCHTVDSLPDLWDNDGSNRLPMWIDMACINQTDVGEKASQIPLMRRIYSRASAVFIWIDEFDSFLRYAFHYLRRVIVEYGDRRDGTLPFEPLGFESVRRLLQCQWFYRRWVIQEAAVPRRAVFLCGADVLTMDHLFAGIDMVSRVLMARPRELKVSEYATVGVFRPLLVLKEIKTRLGKQRQFKLLWLLENLRSTHSTLPHDKIYGLLGFCSEEEVAGNPVRYGLEPEEVYRTFVTTHAQVHHDLDFLGLCTPVQRDTVRIVDIAGRQQRRRFSAPSWVPNWDSGNLRRCLGLSRINYDEKYFNASGALPVDCLFRANDEMVVSGTMVDRIRFLGGDFTTTETGHIGGFFSDPDSKIFQDYFDFFMKLPIGETPYEDELSRVKAFARTISLYGVYLSPVPPPDEVPEMFYRWCRGSTLGKKLEERGLKYEISDTDVPKGFVRMKRLPSWQPFVTQEGYIGLAREMCGVGDEIWIVGGCSVPIVLSPRANDAREVRGEGLLDGFMFGEIMDVPDNFLLSLKSWGKVTLS